MYFFKLKTNKNFHLRTLNNELSKYFSTVELNDNMLVFRNSITDYVIFMKIVRLVLKDKTYKMFSKVEIKKDNQDLLISFSIRAIILDLILYLSIIYLAVPNEFSYFGSTITIFYLFISFIFANSFVTKIRKLAT